jgi:hypothetical protein
MSACSREGGDIRIAARMVCRTERWSCAGAGPGVDACAALEEEIHDRRAGVADGKHECRLAITARGRSPLFENRSMNLKNLAERLCGFVPFCHGQISGLRPIDRRSAFQKDADGGVPRRVLWAPGSNQDVRIASRGSERPAVSSESESLQSGRRERPARRITPYVRFSR